MQCTSQMDVHVLTTVYGLITQLVTGVLTEWACWLHLTMPVPVTHTPDHLVGMQPGEHTDLTLTKPSQACWDMHSPCVAC